jgi:hypothetical protein
MRLLRTHDSATGSAVGSGRLVKERIIVEFSARIWNRASIILAIMLGQAMASWQQEES